MTRNLMKHHFSDCAVHNGPALPAGECNCEAMYDAKQVEVLVSDLRGLLAEEKTRYENRTPTQDAYNAACAALHKHRERADKAELQFLSERQRREKAEAALEKLGYYLSRRICELKDQLNAVPGDIYSQIAEGEARKLFDKFITFHVANKAPSDLMLDELNDPEHAIAEYRAALTQSKEEDDA